MTSPRIAVIGGSVRSTRIGHHLVDWTAARLRAREPWRVAAVDVVDPASCGLPDDGLLQPGGGPVSAVATTLDAADAFVFVTPEYNHSTSGALKNAIDFLFAEWNDKAAGFVSYGVDGGVRAVEHLRQVLGELKVADVRSAVGLTFADDFEGYARFAPRDAQEAGVTGMLDELVAWATALRTIRAPAVG